MKLNVGRYFILVCCIISALRGVPFLHDLIKKVDCSMKGNVYVRFIFKFCLLLHLMALAVFVYKQCIV